MAKKAHRKSKVVRVTKAMLATRRAERKAGRKVPTVYAQPAKRTYERVATVALPALKLQTGVPVHLRFEALMQVVQQQATPAGSPVMPLLLFQVCDLQDDKQLQFLLPAHVTETMLRKYKLPDTVSFQQLQQDWVAQQDAQPIIGKSFEITKEPKAPRARHSTYSVFEVNGS